MPPISLLIAVMATMALGSFVAGFTALGGGAIAFPVLTKLLGYSVAEARQFGVFIQSVGMTSASLYLLRAHRAEILNRSLVVYLAGAFCGAIAGFFALTLDPQAAKTVFSGFIVAFAFINLAKPQFNFELPDALRFGAGLIGGVLSHNIGTGADGVYFIVAAVIAGVPIRVAIWQSIVIMAATSILLALLNLAFAPVTAKVAWSWAAAAPIVVIGASLGAHMTKRVPERALDIAFLMLAGLEAFWTIRSYFG